MAVIQLSCACKRTDCCHQRSLILSVDLRGRGEDLFLWRQLMSIQIEDHLLLAEVQQEADSIS